MKGNGARAGVFVLFLKATSSHPHKAWAFCGLGNLFLGGHSTASLFFPQQRGALSVNGLFTGVWEERAFSGHSSCAFFECQPRRTHKGWVLSLHSGSRGWWLCMARRHHVPGEGGCRRQPEQKSLCNGKGGRWSLLGSIWRACSTQAGHVAVLCPSDLSILS